MERKILTASISKQQFDSLEELKERTGQSKSNLIRQAIMLVREMYKDAKGKKELPLD